MAAVRLPGPSAGRGRTIGHHVYPHQVEAGFSLLGREIVGGPLGGAVLNGRSR
jgi:hypothetical protein